MGQTEHKNIKIRSRKDLEAIRERTRPLLEVERGARIVVGMGTCGLAAGARQVYEGHGGGDPPTGAGGRDPGAR